MRSRVEILLRRTAATAALLTLVSMALAAAGVTRAAWVLLAAIYVTGVAYGLSEMTRLYQRHKRRCRTCFDGARPHLRWWAPRLVLVLGVAVLPVILLLPLFSSFRH